MNQIGIAGRPCPIKQLLFCKGQKYGFGCYEYVTSGFHSQVYFGFHPLLILFGQDGVASSSNADQSAGAASSASIRQMGVKSQLNVGQSKEFGPLELN